MVMKRYAFFLCWNVGRPHPQTEELAHLCHKSNQNKEPCSNNYSQCGYLRDMIPKNPSQTHYITTCIPKSFGASKTKTDIAKQVWYQIRITYSIIFHHIPSYSIIFHHIPSYSIIFHHIPSYSIIFHYIPSYSIIFHHIPSYSIIFLISLFWHVYI